ncbi:hypothetical protein HO133_006223 [Letharia lupina]|uniref:Uncharacterized protein n=1 Tax=Letharia lupina TaxID=560253 RepID=A0A8H6C7X0_9LECA|nr:uncharacterized protein HO133_006223 [Letharia lupina]KAF6218261.1 hypothetical protein HO133_006223 [Letharia lupina]
MSFAKIRKAAKDQMAIFIGALQIVLEALSRLHTHAKPDPTVCSCDNGQYYSTLSKTGSLCAYTTSNPFVLLPPDAGPWTFAPADLEPSTCTATVFPVSTTNLMPTGEFVVESDWEGSNTWLFSADVGMNLSSLGYGEFSQSPFTRNANGSYTLSIPSDGGGQSVTGLASGTPANAAEAYAHEFALTLSTTLTCDIPLPLPCQSNDNRLDSSQWDAFKTDKWWESYVSNYASANYTSVGGRTLFEELVYDYIGPIDQYYCTIGNAQLNADGSLDVGSCIYPSCVDVHTDLSSKDGFRQGYMVLADWEGLSHFLNYCWDVLDQAQNGFDDVITAIFLGTVFTLMCVVLLFIQPFWGGALIATAANAVYAIGASLNGIANIKNLGTPNTAVLEWEGATDTQNNWRNYTGNMKTGLSRLHDSYFLNANHTAPVNISTVLQGGFYLPVTPTVDQTSVIPSDNVTAWLESYACARLINQLFDQNDYYIVYIPYGSMVNDVPGGGSRGNFSFEKSDCEQWVGNSKFNNSVYATCNTVDGIGPGMTVMEGMQDAVLDFTTYNYKTAFTQTFTDGIFTYNPEDVIQSSVAGWLDYGYNYTLVNQNYGFSPDALDSVENFREQLLAVANIRSNSEGVYNLPVCVLNELDSMPECFKAVPENDNDGAKTPLTLDELNYCYIHPINCLGVTARLLEI